MPILRTSAQTGCISQCALRALGCCVTSTQTCGHNVTQPLDHRPALALSQQGTKSIVRDEPRLWPRKKATRHTNVHLLCASIGVATLSSLAGRSFRH